MGNELHPDPGVKFNPTACTQGKADDLGHGKVLKYIEFLFEVVYQEKGIAALWLWRMLGTEVGYPKLVYTF